MEDLQTALDAGKALGFPIKAENEMQVLIVPDSYEAHSLEKVIEPYLARPRRIKANVKLDTLESFTDYVREHQMVHTRVFAANAANGSSSPTLTAVIDFHGPGEPSWNEHRAIYSPVNTEEWKRWTGSDRANMDQLKFATFLEENLAAIVSPPGADLLEMVQTLEGKADARYTAMQRLATGKTKLVYEENTSLTGSTVAGQVEWPSQLELGVALFEGGTLYKVTCRMKYRLASGKITFWYEIVNRHLVVKDAIKEMMAKIKDTLELEPFYGTP